MTDATIVIQTRLRSVLRVGCLAALALCVVSAAGAYQESPMLAEQVAAGTLPPVEERLPENPLVVEPVESIGTYGGTWRRLSLGSRDIQMNSRMGYDPLVHWTRDGQGVEPGLAERWEILDDGRTFVFHLRRGLRWSDGAPLTSADFMFHFKDVLDEKELSTTWPQWLKLGGENADVSAPDDCTVVFRFKAPYGTFLGKMAYQGNYMPLPKHYLSQFHPTYADPDTLQAMLDERGFDQVRKLFWDRADLNRNPDMPTWRPFKIKTPPPSSRMVAVRNPYYWKVDTAGNQLPYIDEIAFTDVQNNEVVTMKAMSGEVDFQARRIDASAYPLFMQNAEARGYRVMRDIAPDTVCLYINQCSKDPELRELLQNRDFRIALSLAINRDELIFLLYSQMAKASRGVVCPDDPYYLPAYDEKYLSYDPARASALLDGIGMKRGANGMRRLPSGEPFRQMLYVYPSEAGTSTELWQLVAEYFREVGLDFIIKLDSVNLSVIQICNGNSDFWAYQQPGMLWVMDPKWHLPFQASSYFAPLYGRYVASDGKDEMGVPPAPEWQEMLDWYAEMDMIVDDGSGPIPPRKLELGRQILGRWADECYVIGICRQELLTIVADKFRNVPDRIIHDWRLFTPGYIGIEQFYIVDGE
ncbi:MAG: ABC transporter substrate-binding protein [bacterium]|nr:ABC transporter substrate-binding protein [bacterium]